MNAKKLIENRKKIKCSQFRLAKEAGVSRFKISLFESGYTPLSSLELNKIDKALKKIKQTGGVK